MVDENLILKAPASVITKNTQKDTNSSMSDKRKRDFSNSS